MYLTKRYLWNVSDEHILRSWFFAMFMPIIIYGISIYSSASSTCLDKLICSYNQAVKIIFSLIQHKNGSNFSAYCYCKLFPSFISIRNTQDIKLLSKYIQGFLPVDAIFFNVPQVITRKIDLLFIPKHRLNRTTNSFFYQSL